MVTPFLTYDGQIGLINGDIGGSTQMSIVEVAGGSAVTINATPNTRYEVTSPVPSITINCGNKSAKEIQVDFTLDAGTASTVTFTGCTAHFGVVNFEGGNRYLASIQFATYGAVELA